MEYNKKKAIYKEIAYFSLIFGLSKIKKATHFFKKYLNTIYSNDFVITLSFKSQIGLKFLLILVLSQH